MKKQNKDKASVAEHDELAFEEDCKELITALVENSQARLKEDVDPFESYVQRVGSKIHLGDQQFTSRFVKGYQALLEELKREKGSLPS